MKKRVLIGIVIVLCAVLGIIFLPREIEEIVGSSEKISEAQIYQVKDDEVALVYNYSLQKAKAVYKDGVVYIPLNWTRSILNDKFYYSDDEKLLSYALPTEIVYANFENKDKNGKPLLLEKDNKIYISIETVKTYTDIWTDIFTDGDIKKIYINDNLGEYEEGNVKSKSVRRVDASMLSASIENVELEKDSKVTVVEQKGKWDKVLTESGVMGYIRGKHLKRQQSQQLCKARVHIYVDG